MNIATLNELLMHKGDAPRVSIIVSTELKSFSDKEKITLKFKNIIDAVKKELHPKYDKKMVDLLVNSIKSALKNVDVNHLQKGIGVYASLDFIRQILFPFPVTDKLVINRYFEVSDVIATLDKLEDYSVLLLSKNNTRFFKGKGNELSEIIDENFPQHYENEFQMERTPSNYMKNNGVEVSSVKSIRLEDYFKKLDKLVGGYIKNKPLIIVGVIKHISTFKKICTHDNLIITELTGNYDKSTPQLISQLVWPEFEKYRKKENDLHSNHL